MQKAIYICFLSIFMLSCELTPSSGDFAKDNGGAEDDGGDREPSCRGLDQDKCLPPGYEGRYVLESEDQRSLKVFNSEMQGYLNNLMDFDIGMTLSRQSKIEVNVDSSEHSIKCSFTLDTTVSIVEINFNEVSLLEQYLTTSMQGDCDQNAYKQDTIFVVNVDSYLGGPDEDYGLLNIYKGKIAGQDRYSITFHQEQSSDDFTSQTTAFLQLNPTATLFHMDEISTFIFRSTELKEGKVVGKSLIKTRTLTKPLPDINIATLDLNKFPRIRYDEEGTESDEQYESPDLNSFRTKLFNK